MNGKHRNSGPRPTGRPERSGRRRREPRITVRRVAVGDHWVLVHPHCVRERAEDIEEVHKMVAAGEPEIAVDELRWLLDACPDFIEAHQLLGALALECMQDIPLARGHFGCGYQLGLDALRRAGMPRPLCYREPANRAFFEAGRGLVECLHKIGDRDLAREVRDQLLACDPENLTLASWI